MSVTGRQLEYPPNTWRLNNTLQNNPWVKYGSREIFRTKWKSKITICDAQKAVLRGNLSHLNAFIRKEEWVKPISFHLWKVEKMQNKPKASRREEIIQIRIEVKEIWYKKGRENEGNQRLLFEEFKPRTCHTQRSASEREKQISDVNAYMWNLGKWYRWSYFRGRNRDTDVEDNHVDTKGGGEAGWDELGDWSWHIYTVYIDTIDTVYKLADEDLL